VPKRARARSNQPTAAANKPVELSSRDVQTVVKLQNLAQGVQSSAARRQDPFLDIPSRTLANVRFNQKKRFIEMGKRTNRRELFNLSQARSYMQTLLAGSGCADLIRRGKTSSIRGLYYKLKHTIQGTKENTFNDQPESDAVVEDLEVLVGALREELHLFAEKRGDLVGPIVIEDLGNDIDCARMGSGGYGIPSICEPDRIGFKKCTADFILHVEKGTVWQRFNEDRFWEKYNCILTHGAGQPTRGTRRLLHRLHNELNLPVYCLLDNDPWGYYIYSVIKQGSINLAFESTRMAIPQAKFMGIRSIDLERCELDPGVSINLTDTDIKRAKQIRKYPWFEGKKSWQKEIDRMLSNGFKLEVEALISKDISYVTEVYVPERLEQQDFLD